MNNYENYISKAKKALALLHLAYKQKNDDAFSALRSQSLKEYKYAEKQLNKMGVTNLCQALSS